MKLTDLDPHFFRRVASHQFEHTDDITCAEGLQLNCPACHWVSRRRNTEDVSHMILLWRDPKRWHFEGTGYNDLSLMAGRVRVTMVAGACRCGFLIKNGKVDFY